MEVCRNECIRLEKSSSFISQQQDAATTVQTDQLSSIPLSALSLDNSGLPVVQYGLHAPLAASTPNRTVGHKQNLQQRDTYQEIIPGIPQGSLYPTLSALSSGSIAIATNEHSLCNKVTKGIFKKENSYKNQKTTTLMILPDLQTHHQYWKQKIKKIRLRTRN